MIQEFSAGFVIFRVQEGQRLYLILHCRDGHYDLCKGHLEKGENNFQAALRELWEETGIIDPQVISGYEEQISYEYIRGKNLVRESVTFFLAQTATPDIQISDEHLRYLWLDYSSALRTITFENTKNILVEAEQHLTK